MADKACRDKRTTNDLKLFANGRNVAFHVEILLIFGIVFTCDDLLKAFDCVFKRNIYTFEAGVVEISNSLVKILADTAEDIDSLDQLKIEEAKKQAQHLIASAKNDVEYADATAHLEKQIAKLNIIKRRRKYR